LAIRHKLEYAPVWLLVKILGRMPRSLAHACAISLAWLVYILHGRLRRVGKRNLELAFPEKSPGERTKILRGVFTSLGRQLAEFCRFPRYNRDNIGTLAAYEGFEAFEAASKRGKGVLFLTAHLGGWEIGSFAHSLHGHHLQIVVRPLDNPYVNRLVDRYRTMHGNATFEKQDFARGLLSAMKEGATVGVLMDQNMTPPQGVFVDFFGIPACTASGVARVALRTDAAVVPAFTIWDDRLRKYRVHFAPAVPLVRTGDDEKDVVVNTAAFTRAIEDYIRRYPDQWLWVHRRWKTRPAGAPPAILKAYRTRPRAARPEGAAMEEAEFGVKLERIAAAVGARLIGPGTVEIVRVSSLKSAAPGSLVFVEGEKALSQALDSAASAIIAGETVTQADGRKPLLVGRQPRLLFARAAALLEEPCTAGEGIHPSAIVQDPSGLGRGVSAGPYAVIGAGAILGEGTRIGANVVVGEGVRLGAGCDIRANVTIYPGTRLGDRVIVHAGAVLGSDGFGYVRDESTGRYEKFPQIGRLEIGDDVEIGANSTIDRGALDATVIAEGAKIDNLVHVGHNVSIGKNVVIAAQTGVSGSSVIEDNVVVAGQVGIADHVRIEEGAILGAQSGIPSNKIIRGKGILFWGTPARPIREYLKELAVLARLARK